MKSGYVVKGCTVRGYWNTAKRIAVQIRYKSGTEPVQNWDRSGTEVRQKWDICRARRGGRKTGASGPTFPPSRLLITRMTRRAEQDTETGRRMQKQAETIPRRIQPSSRLRSVANFQAVNALPCVSKRPKTRYRRPVCRQRPVLAAKNRN